MSAPTRPPLVEVEWVDATSRYEQMSLEEAREKCKLDHRFSAGYVVKKTREELTICHTFDAAVYDDKGEDGGADFTTIPRGWIRNLIVLTPAADQAAEKEE